MKLPKTMKRLCPKCKTHTTHKVIQQKNKGANKTRTMSRASTPRLNARGLRRGTGNFGRYSRKAVSAFKMTGAKVSKKTDLRYTCETCKKTQVQASGTRAKRIEFK